MIDGFVKSPSAALRFIFKSLRRTGKYTSFLKILAPCIWSFLLCRLIYDFLRNQQASIGIGFI